MPIQHHAYSEETTGRADGEEPLPEFELTGTETGELNKWIVLPGTGTRVRVVEGGKQDHYIRVEYGQQTGWASATFRARVRDIALRTAAEEGWCEQVNGVLDELGLERGTRFWNWTAQINVVINEGCLPVNAAEGERIRAAIGGMYLAGGYQDEGDLEKSFILGPDGMSFMFTVGNRDRENGQRLGWLGDRQLDKLQDGLVGPIMYELRAVIGAVRLGTVTASVLTMEPVDEDDT